MMEKWMRKFKWLWVICLTLIVYLIPNQKVLAETSVAFDTYYNIKAFENESYFQITVPENGRVRVLVEDCTNNTFQDYYSLGSAESSERSAFVYRSWKKGTENADSGWISVSPGEYTYNLPYSTGINQEAKLKVEYQSVTEYFGEVEENDSFDTASLLTAGSVYYGDWSTEYKQYYYATGCWWPGWSSADVDYYKFTLNAPGYAEIVFNNLDISSYNIKYSLYEEDSNGNINLVATTSKSKQHYRLPAGIYYIKTENLDIRIEEYTLQVNVTYESANESEQEYNNIKNKANSKNCNQWYSGNLNTSSDLDYYSFYVPVQSSLAIELKVPRQINSNTYQAILYDSNLIALSDTSNTSNPYSKSEEVIVEPGTYYIRVESGSYYLNDDYSISLYQQPFVYVSSISISGAKKMQDGETLGLTAGVTPSNATNQEVEWSSSNTYYASVSSTGVVTANNPGTVTITASAQDGSGVEKSVDIEITEKLVSGISISGKTGLKKSEGYYLSATVKPTDAANKSIKWSSSNSSIVSVTSDGYVYAKGYGTAVITVKAQDGSAVTGSITITVPKPVIALNKKTATITKGKSVTLKLNGASGSVKWTTSKKSVATVSSKGVVKGKKKGSAKITAIYKGVKYTCTVTVKNPSKSTLAKNAYKAYAKKNLKTSKYPGRKIKYYDIDKNNVPEMIVSYRSGAMLQYQFYTYYKGKVVKMHSKDYSGSSIYKIANQKKQICLYVPDGSEGYYIVYKISNRKVKKVATYYCDWYYEKYYKNGKRISTSKMDTFFDNLQSL